ncbi:MAG: type 1 glutamine amidotransferase [Chloroflexota bacterium]|nr:type 1 glutamine amidotransferase [Chloroflexota bacterium]
MRIGITQRVITMDEIGERRDSLDQRWTTLMTGLGFTPILLPNMISDINAYLSDVRLDGVVLTGGGDIMEYATESSATPERDRLEQALIEYCIHEDLPLIGICRGFQSIVNHFGGRLKPIKRHVAIHHQIRLDESFMPGAERTIKVNSFHNLGIFQEGLPKDLRALAWTEDGTVEAATLNDHKIIGIMWHPEREHPTTEFDKALFLNLFVRNTF